MGVGLAGCGGVARQFHLRALVANPAAALVAVADPDPAARAAAAAAAPGAEPIGDPGELIARDDVEAVVVCSPPATHRELAGLTLAAGKHLYLEKPVALSARDAAELAERAGGSDVVGAVGFSYRFNPAFAKLRERLRSGDVGTVRAARCIHLEPGLAESAPAWKRARESGGGVVLDLASHSVDMARWLLGTEVAGVETAVISSVHSEADDLRASVRMTDGTTVELISSYLRGRGHRWDVRGEGGVLTADRWPPAVRRRRRFSRGVGRARRAFLGLPIPRRERSFERAMQRFVAAARGEPRGELATLADGARSLEAVLEIERAAAAETLPT